MIIHPSISWKLPFSRIPAMFRNPAKGILDIRDCIMSHKECFEPEVLGLYRGPLNVSEHVVDVALETFNISKYKITEIVHFAENTAREYNREFLNNTVIEPDFPKLRVECCFYIYLHDLLTRLEIFFQTKRFLWNRRVRNINGVRNELYGLDESLNKNVLLAMEEARIKHRIDTACVVVHQLFDYLTFHCLIDGTEAERIVHSSVQDAHKFLVKLVKIEKEIGKQIPSELLVLLIIRVFTDILLTQLEIHYTFWLN